MMSNNPYDPMGLDRGPMTRGVRHSEDYRSHIDRLNGPWPCGPAVVPAIEERESQTIEAVEALDEIDAILAKKKKVVEADAAVELDPVSPVITE